jgi:phage shock protein A
MEAEADMVNYGRRPSLHDELAVLEGDEELERELAALKANSAPPQPPKQAL